MEIPEVLQLHLFSVATKVTFIAIGPSLNLNKIAYNKGSQHDPEWSNLIYDLKIQYNRETIQIL